MGSTAYMLAFMLSFMDAKLGRRTKENCAEHFRHFADIGSVTPPVLGLCGENLPACCHGGGQCRHVQHVVQQLKATRGNDNWKDVSAFFQVARSKRYEDCLAVETWRYQVFWQLVELIDACADVGGRPAGQRGAPLLEGRGRCRRLTGVWLNSTGPCLGVLKGSHGKELGDAPRCAHDLRRDAIQLGKYHAHQVYRLGDATHITLCMDCSDKAGKDMLSLLAYEPVSKELFWMVPQVMPALKTTVRGLKGRLAVRRTALQERVAARLRSLKEAAEIEKVKGKRKSGTLTRRAAYHMGRALGWLDSLMHAGSSLAKFHNRSQCVPVLKASEQRYTKPSKTPSPCDLPDGVSWRRSCVWDRETKRARFDVPVGETARSQPCLTIVADEGPKDAPLYHWLSAHGFRFVWLMDPLHRCPNDMRMAAIHSDNWNMILDTSAALNFDAGPFKSSQNFNRAVEAVKEYAVTAFTDEDLLMSYFEDMCKLSGDVPVDFGTLEHVQRVIDRLPFEACFARMDERVKWSRWGSHQRCMREFKPHRLLNRFVLDVVDILCSSTGAAAGHETVSWLPCARPGESKTAVSGSPSPGQAAAPSFSAAPSSSSSPAAAPVAAGLAEGALTASPETAGDAAGPPRRFERPSGLEEVREVLGHAETWVKADIWTTFAETVYKAAAAEYSGFLNDEEHVLKYYVAYAAWWRILGQDWEDVGIFANHEHSIPGRVDGVFRVSAREGVGHGRQLRAAEARDLEGAARLVHRLPNCPVAQPDSSELRGPAAWKVRCSAELCARGCQRCVGLVRYRLGCYSDFRGKAPRLQRIRGAVAGGAPVRVGRCSGRLVLAQRIWVPDRDAQGAGDCAIHVSLGSTIGNEKGWQYLGRRLEEAPNKRLGVQACWMVLATSNV
ncbi:unnamed protein product [Prorocentrum cordatum]|uniref:Uncharacterized protein n=1 Tax=Prorocentrum cordatum TaxID=2364126 RepID=A0ABN9VRH1_9DINO|nr:unnamed protein product [Polarella glacialis]